MKLNFTILLIFFCLSKNLTAQVEQPNPAQIEDGKVFYLYNCNYRGFLVGGNNYNTQASLSRNHAYKVKLEKYIDENEEWDGKTFFITDSVEMGDFRGVYRKMFIENNKKIYLDQDEQGGTRLRDNLWSITPIEGKNNIYRITPSSLNKNKYINKQLGVIALSTHSLPVIGIYDPINNNNDYEWCFVSSEDKEHYFENKQSNRYSTRLEVLKRSSVDNFIPDEQVVYMMNVDYDGFLVGGNLYNTQASLSKTDAHKVILHKYIDIDGIWDGKSYYITDSVRDGSYSGKYRNLYIDQNAKIWVDQEEKRSGHFDCIWEITQTKDNTSFYYIKPSDKNNVFRASSLTDFYLGGRIHDDYRELPTLELIEREKGYYCRWTFITEEQWKKLEAIDRKEELHYFINNVKTLYPDVDISQAKYVYDNIDATPSEIENQIGMMRLILLSNGNRNKKSVDFTSLINNSDFEGTGGHGWNMPFDVSLGKLTWYGGDEQNHCAEGYQAIFDFYQEIKGIPNGLYRIDLQAFSRTRGADLAWLERDSSYIVTEFYANNVSLPVMNLMHTTFHSDEDEFDFLNADMSKSIHNWSEPKWQCMDGTFALNNMRATALAFLKGYFDQSLYCFVDKGVIKIGIRERHKKTGSWVSWDNFRLNYLSETVENYKDAINCHLEKALEINKLAKTKGINTENLSESIALLEDLLKTKDIDSMRKGISSINYFIAETRKIIELKEFANIDEESISSDWQEIEDNNSKIERIAKEKNQAKQDSIKRINDMANSYFVIGNMVANQNNELALQYIQKGFDYFIPHHDFNTVLDGYVSILTSNNVENEQYNEAITNWNKFIKQLNISMYYNLFDNIGKIANAYFEIGYIHFLKKEYKQSEESYRKAHKMTETLYNEISAEPTDTIKQNGIKDLLSVIYNGLAYTLAYQKQYDDALNTIEQSIVLQPNNPNFYDSKGELLYLKGDKKGAATMLKKVIELDPDFIKKTDSQLYKLLYKK